jgi:putative ABC transport system permease protein
MEAELRGMTGISRVQAVRNARVVFRDTPVMIVATDIASIAETVPVDPVSGDADTMYAQTAAGSGLMISDNFAELQRLTVGDVLEIPAPHGVIRLPVAGVVLDYSDQQGTILMDRSLFERYWRDDSVNLFRLYLAPGAQVSAVKERILERYQGERQVFVLTNGEVRTYILGITDQWFSLASVQIAVAVLVAILGIVNTLTVSITDRRRELGVLRAVGGMAGQIRRTIWMEAISIGVLGLILGFAFGALNL